MNDRDGGPAFEALGGLTVLDYFAAKAMQALLARDAGDADMALIAAAAYLAAEAMLDERKE